MNRKEILKWLREERPQRLDELWARADEVRHRNVGNAIHLRGLIECSNHCRRHCAYCGIRADNERVERYRLTPDELISSALLARQLGYGTVVIQGGEDPGIEAEELAAVIRRIKVETPLAVTLGLGEREEAELALWRKAGADRYLLRFETSDRLLYDRLHPSLPHQRSDRIALLKQLRELGYEIGGGVMISLPGQTYETLADDLELFRALELDMIGVGPYLPHPATPLGQNEEAFRATEGRQTPNSEQMAYKVLALARIVCPLVNLPSTTAIATVNPTDGYRLGLTRGANVVMPNLTPMQYREKYEIYPNKAGVFQSTQEKHAGLTEMIRSIGRTVGTGRGDSPRRKLAA